MVNFWLGYEIERKSFFLVTRAGKRRFDLTTGTCHPSSITDRNSHVVITQLYNGEVCYIVLNEGHMSVSSNHWFEKPFIKILREYN